MGWLGDVSNWLGNRVGDDPVKGIINGAQQNPISTIGGIGGGWAGAAGGAPFDFAMNPKGSAIGQLFPSGNPPTTPGMDPRISAIKDAQFKQAKDFRSNLGGFENDQFNNFRNQGLRDLASQVKTTSHSLGSRGLGYGGIAQGAQAKNAAKFSYNMAQGKADINRSSEDMANQLEADALNSGFLMQRTQQGIQDTVYNQAIQDYQNRNSMMNGLFQGAGMVGGFALAKGK